MQRPLSVQALTKSSWSSILGYTGVITTAGTMAKRATRRKGDSQEHESGMKMKD
ncbi:uncharacterized protein K460DRAFT_362918 [Cucurbitaria berberidis CBS 394.84]|uniref:Uncharacterized protein n=1 Tax=Cucurbitaria berberidis CBS 394.84 TaxID=1168544 RepID=A0A9P4GUN9_9PLEO|nr:uncharacterized protein K460DRAFT_362918 [Cucurbitaria berberidis CBS 394.84]KAF1852152.1 hypothetical protein K460DRAFT_362918 [Cucurbitaria berberidis CBS 394.84]